MTTSSLKRKSRSTRSIRPALRDAVLFDVFEHHPVEMYEFLWTLEFGMDCWDLIERWG